MELLKLPNLATITTKLNSHGGIDIIKLDFKATTNLNEVSHTNRPRHK